MTGAGPIATGRAAVYCWVPDRTDRDQTAVAEQESLARAQAARLGLGLDARHVFADTRLTAWTPGRPRPGWRAMLAAARAGEFRHLFLHRGERLERHPSALIELLDVAGAHALAVHGHPDDLSDPGQRAAALDRARLRLRRLEQASERARSARREAAAVGQSHGGGLRRYGYLPGMAGLVEAEAQVVREIFARFLAGESLRALALDLNARTVPTAYGKPWTVGGVSRIVDAPRYAGLVVLGGEILRSPDGGYAPAAWAACVSVGDWEAARALRHRRAGQQASARRPSREYPLTSLVQCTRCDRQMVGSAISGYPTYACTSNSSLQQGRCSRRIGAEQLEAYVFEHTVRLLETLDAGSLPAARATGTTPAAPTRTARDAHRAVVLRRADALDGVTTGPRARFGWERLPMRRRAEVARFLFSAVRIAQSSTARSVFDTGRIDLVPYRAAH